MVLSDKEDTGQEEIVINMVEHELFNSEKYREKALHDNMVVKVPPLEATKAEKKSQVVKEPCNQEQQLPSQARLFSQIPSITRVVTPWGREAVDDLAMKRDQERNLPFETQAELSGWTQRKQQKGGKKVLESVKSHGGDVVSEKRVHDIFKDIHDWFIEIKAPRSGLVLGIKIIYQIKHLNFKEKRRPFEKFKEP